MPLLCSEEILANASEAILSANISEWFGKRPKQIVLCVELSKID